MRRISFFLLLLCISGVSHLRATVLSLNDTNPGVVWQLKPQAELSSGGSEISMPGFRMDNFVKGVVPGIVFTAYVEAGLEKDPNYAGNIYEVDESFYNRPFWYRTEFTLPSSYREGQRVWIHFNGTNRFADFFFNGHKLSGTPTSTKDVSGHMIRSKFDITDLVHRNGKNAVAVLITDADQKKNRHTKGSFGVASSPTYLAAAGWDWMPYVPGRLAGITGDVFLKLSGDVTMEDPWVRSELQDTNSKAELVISSELKNSAATTREVCLEGVIQPGNIRFSKKIAVNGKSSAAVTIDKNDLSELIINNPRLWWPNGYGAPDLYTCALSCTIDGIVSDEKEIRFGIRKYSYEMIDNVAGMPVLTFFINGQKIFLKGGNWGMSEYLLRCRDKEYETKIQLHKDMNYNMIRLWTGCVTDDAFYDYCDSYGIMVWDDFWLYVAYNEVEQPEAFKANALDKVKRLRNHPSIAIWCGANETHPVPELDNYLREMITREDNNDRMYKSSSNQDGLSGSGWWGNQPPKHHFETSGSNLAFNNPPYPYGSDRGYGLRTEIGTATFPTYESVIRFIPFEHQWPLPTDEQLKEEDDNVWNRHFFGKEASNANPVNYKRAVNTQFGESASLQEFCEKAQLLNLEVMKGMYEAWNDKMWQDATGLLIWMSQSAYPSFVWQTYDYYYDATGAYWGAKKACEPLHIQWNASSNSVKAINTSTLELTGVTAKATIFDSNGKELPAYGRKAVINVAASDKQEAFRLNFNPYNLANGKTTVASSATIPGPASLAVDGGAGSRWESEYSDAQWLYVDLGKKERIETVVVKWEAAHALEYELQVSDNAKHWKTVYKTNQSAGGTEEIAIKPVNARYVRINCISRATIFGYSIYELEVFGKSRRADKLSPLHFIRLELCDRDGTVIADNFYWRNGVNDLDFRQLSELPEASLSYTIRHSSTNGNTGRIEVLVKNNSGSIAFANRLRLVNSTTHQRVLPVIMNDNYFSLMPFEEKVITLEAAGNLLEGGVDLLAKPYLKEEKKVAELQF